MKQITTKSGIKGYQCHLQDNYSSFAEFGGYDDVCNLAARLGFKTAKEAWKVNPVIQFSANPEDFCTVSAPTPVQKEGSFTGGEWRVNERFKTGIMPYISNETDVICYIALNPSASLNNQPEAEANAALIAESKNMWHTINAFVTTLGPLTKNPVHHSIMEQAKAILNRINQQG